MTVKELMTKHFETEPREPRSTLNEPLAPTRSRSSRPPPSREYLPELPRDGRLPQFEVQSLVNSLIPPSVVEQNKPPRKKLHAFVAMGIVVAVGSITGVLLATRSTIPGGQPAASVFPTEQRKPAAAIEPGARQPSAEFVWLTLSAVPNDAEIRLDGRRISNPYRAAHGRDAISHHVTVSLDGYQTLEREVSLSKDLELQLSLDAASRGGSRKSKRQSASAPQVEVNPPSANPTPLTPVAPPSLPVGAPKTGEQKAAVLKPGDDLRKLDTRTLNTRDIDETDPYKR